jgi:predicted phosphodiesterase
MTNERIAILADIHGNIWALDAVLADLDRAGITRMLDLGDSLFGPLDPAATADRLIERAIPSIRGNCDRIILDPPPDAGGNLAYTREHLSPRHLAWLSAQPATRDLEGGLLLCHGTPRSDDTSLLEELTLQGPHPRAEAAIRVLLGPCSATLVLCAHTHTPRVLALAGGPLLVNPGSVGLPAYREDEPTPHIMETDSPHARYAVLWAGENGWHVEHHAIPYDWERAAAQAEAAGRADWAGILRTGRAPE